MRAALVAAFALLSVVTPATAPTLSNARFATVSEAELFEAALQKTLKAEGGYYDGSGAHDPNPTYRGIVQRTYDGFRDRRRLPRRPVREIADEELRDIYRNYWRAANCHLLPPLTGRAVFDHAVNAGPVPATKVLQRALDVKPDGVFGPKTAAALIGRDDAALALRVALYRAAHYCDIARSNPTKRPALLAWIERATDHGKDAANFSSTNGC